MKRVLIITLVILLLTIVLFTITHLVQSSDTSLDTPIAKENRWKLTPINFGTISINKNLSGRVRIEGIVKISSEISGKLKTLSVEEGSKILKGQLLAEIDDDKLQAIKKSPK
jgi:multidrug efflux pump subunit AcrA (membrane-fusion protein)